MNNLPAKLNAAWHTWCATRIRRQLADHQADVLAQLQSHAKRQLRTARYHTRRARARRIYAAWANPRNPGYHRERPVHDARPASDIQFPRVGSAIAHLHLVRREVA